MKGLTCKYQDLGKARSLSTVPQHIIANKALKSSGHQTGLDHVILLRLKGMQVFVSKSRQRLGSTRKEVNISELTFVPTENTNTEILIHSPLSIQIAEYGSCHMMNSLAPPIYTLNELPDQETQKEVGGTHAE
jgi:hypothetical protein